MGDDTLRVAGLFAGVGGIEEGLRRAGHRTELLCESEPAAQRVLRAHFGDARLHDDVRTLEELPAVDLVTAGFPCKDLSQAGETAGIDGSQSSLVNEVFRLLDDSAHEPEWILFENVPFMLRLDRGRAMEMLVDALESRDYSWAYRTVDTRAFGIPHRRERVLLLASRTRDPRRVLFRGNELSDLPEYSPGASAGFYWTEGRTGVGWAVESIPPLKAGSGVGIPSPPAMWLPERDVEIVTPDLRDAERFQGLDAEWTAPATKADGVRDRHRWALVGNAVSVPVAEWLGRALYTEMDKPLCLRSEAYDTSDPWPDAAYGGDEGIRAVVATTWPVRSEATPLSDFLDYEPEPLSHRAAAGFLSRARESTLNFEDGFLDAVATHVRMMEQKTA